jgi:hypothetical protein
MWEKELQEDKHQEVMIIGGNLGDCIQHQSK